MRPLYATRLTTFVPTASSSDEHHAELVALCHSWLRRVADRHGVEGLDQNPNVSLIFDRPAAGCSGDTRHTRIDGFSVWRGTIIHPYTIDDHPTDDIIRADLQVISDPGETTVVVRILAGAQTEVLLPSRPSIHPPRLVRDIIQRYETRVGNIEARTTPRLIGADTIWDLERDLFRPDRLIPIVVISRTFDQELLLHPTQLADQLAGLAQVVELQDFDTAFALTDCVTKELSAFNGAVRIYWPKFHVSANPYLHRLYLPNALQGHYENEQIKRQIRGYIADVAASRITLDPRVGRVEREFQRRKALASEQERSAQVTRLLREIADLANVPAETATLADIPTLLDELSDRFAQERDARTAEVERHEQDMLELMRDYDENRFASDELLAIAESEREAYRDRAEKAEARLQSLLVANGATDNGSAAPIEDLTLILGARKLEDLVDIYAERAPADCIVFLPECKKTAAQAGFTGSLASVAEMMTRLVRAAMIYHDPEWTTGVREAFWKADEPSYSADVSDTARQQHRHEYLRRYDDGDGMAEILLGPHLSFGSGNSHSTVDIYFYVDTKNRRIVVGHIGNHLSGKRTT